MPTEQSPFETRPNYTRQAEQRMSTKQEVPQYQYPKRFSVLTQRLSERSRQLGRELKPAELQRAVSEISEFRLNNRSFLEKYEFSTGKDSDCFENDRIITPIEGFICGHNSAKNPETGEIHYTHNALIPGGDRLLVAEKITAVSAEIYVDVFDLQGHGPKAAPMSEVVSEFYTEQPCITPEERVDRFKTTHKFIQESLPVDKFFSKKTQVISLRVFQEKGGPTKTMEVLQAGDGYLFYLERNAEGKPHFVVVTGEAIQENEEVEGLQKKGHIHLLKPEVGTVSDLGWDIMPAKGSGVDFNPEDELNNLQVLSLALSQEAFIFASTDGLFGTLIRDKDGKSLDFASLFNTIIEEILEDNQEASLEEIAELFMKKINEVHNQGIATDDDAFIKIPPFQFAS